MDAPAEDVVITRYWRRARHRIIMRFGGNGGRTLDVGGGSSRILQDLPGAAGVDVLLRKLRFLHRVHPEVVQASVNALPFPDLNPPAVTAFHDQSEAYIFDLDSEELLEL